MLVELAREMFSCLTNGRGPVGVAILWKEHSNHKLLNVNVVSLTMTSDNSGRHEIYTSHQFTRHSIVPPLNPIDPLAHLNKLLSIQFTSSSASTIFTVERTSLLPSSQNPIKHDYALLLTPRRKHFQNE